MRWEVRRRGTVRVWVLLALFAMAAALLSLALWRARSTSTIPVVREVELGGNAARGRRMIRSYGCGACHSVTGVVGANGRVGPPLSDVGGRAYIAGVLPNTPENLVRWIRYPQEVAPDTAMPNLGVTEADARDIATYLYRLERRGRWGYPLPGPR